MLCRLQIYTSDIRGAGTDARVFITLFGSNGINTHKIPLDDSKNNFERGMVGGHANVPCLIMLLIRGNTNQHLCGVRDLFDHAPSGCLTVLHPCGTCTHACTAHSLFVATPLACVNIDLLLKSHTRPSSALVGAYASWRLLARLLCHWRTGICAHRVGRPSFSLSLCSVNACIVQAVSSTLSTGARLRLACQVDVFFKEYPDLGDIPEVEIEHDNSGMKPGWHCEQVRGVAGRAADHRPWGMQGLQVVIEC